MKKPIIAVLGAHVKLVDRSVPVVADYANRTYCAAVEQAGGIPILLPIPENPEDMDSVLDLCHGLLLPGGIDVDPRFYNEDPTTFLGTVDASMDRFWIHATEYAMEHGLPVLGICRGLQLVNVALKGSLYQDLTLKNPEHLLHTQKQNRDYLMHQVAIEPDSRLAEILGASAIYTNTMHHQCAKEIGRGLRVTACTGDGIPEALETADGQFILVQWHPEELLSSEPRMKNLFTDLVERSAKQFSRTTNKTRGKI